MTSAEIVFSISRRTRQTCLISGLQSAVLWAGSCVTPRQAYSLDYSSGFPLGTVFINVLGSFVIGYFGTLTLHSGKYPVSENVRLFVMVGICGGFTTFSSFSLQSFDLARSGAWGRALANIVFSVVLCIAAVAAAIASPNTPSPT